MRRCSSVQPLPGSGSAFHGRRTINDQESKTPPTQESVSRRDGERRSDEGGRVTSGRKVHSDVRRRTKKIHEEPKTSNMQVCNWWRLETLENVTATLQNQKEKMRGQEVKFCSR